MTLEKTKNSVKNEMLKDGYTKKDFNRIQKIINLKVKELKLKQENSKEHIEEELWYVIDFDHSLQIGEYCE